MSSAIAGSSLLQAHAEMVHREHSHWSFHSHNRLHKKQDAAQPSNTVTLVTQTISAVQEVSIDTNGSTMDLETVLADNTSIEAPTGLSVVGETVSSTATGVESKSTSTTSAQPALTTKPPTSTASSATIQPSSASGSARPSQSLSQSLSQTQTQTSATASTPSSSDTTSIFHSLARHNTTSVSALSSTFHSLASTNTSTSTSFLLSSASSRSTTTTKTSSLLSTISLSTSTSNSLFFTSSSFISSTSSGSKTSPSTELSSTYLPPSVSSAAASTTGINGGIIGSTGTQNAGTTTSTAGAGGAVSNKDNTSPSSPGAIAGGVVGGIAGAAILLFIVSLIIRWKRKNQFRLALGNGTDRDMNPAPAATDPSNSGAMVEHTSSSGVPTALAALAGHKRVSHQPSVDASSTADSERGFYRVSGRKIQSVLETGGDGYGDQEPRDTLSGSSFYRDSQGFYGGTGSHLSPLVGATMQPMNRDSDIPVFSRPGPARTPIISQGPFVEPSTPSPLEPPSRPDGLGRSHPSQDGSHGSRFTEEV